MDFAVMFDMKFVVEGFVCVSSILEHGPASRVFVLNLDPVMERVVPHILPDERVVNISRATLEARYPRVTCQLAAPLVAVSSSQFPTPARRAKNSALASGRLLSEFRITMPHWRDALSAYLIEKGHLPA